MHFYITGDTHKKFDRVETFCQDHHTTPDDVMIILGDSGINYWLSPKDEKLKERVNRIPVTFFVYTAIMKVGHGNLRRITNWCHGMAVLYTKKKNIRIFYLQKMGKSMILTENQ